MREKLIEDLEKYGTANQFEQGIAQRIITLIQEKENCFWRDCFEPGHVTGSALLLNKTFDKVLLMKHAALGFWMQFGGHADGEENILKASTRECIEESGIENIQPIHPHIFDIDIHRIPENKKKNEPAHYHHDICYLFYVPDDTVFVMNDESTDMKWFSVEELNALETSGDYLNRMAKKWEKLLTSKAA